MAYARFYVKGVDLAKCLATQNEKGNYWLKNGALARFILSEFNKPHSGYVMKADGSHKSYPNENAIDFSVLGDVTSDNSMKLNGMLYIKGYKVPYGLEWVWGNHHLLTFHVKTKWKVGNRVPAGQAMCTVMTPAENKASGRFDKDYPNGFPSHLHFGTNTGGSYEKTTIRQFILEVPVTPPVVIPPVEATVVIPEKVYQGLLKKELDDAKSIEALNSLLTMKNAEIVEEQKKTQIEQDLKYLYQLGVDNISKVLGVIYDINEVWDTQKYKYEGILATIKSNALKQSSKFELIKALIDKFIGK